MIDPPEFYLEILKFRFSLYMVKDDWPPWPEFDHLARIWPEFLKFRFSLYIVKDDWPPTRILPEFLKFRFSLYIVKDDWPPTLPGFYQNF